MLKANIPELDRERVVIVGAGFAGLNTAFKLRKSSYQIVLLDRQNFHQFQPLFYQVAMSGLEPSSIIFPLRKAFQNYDNIHIRVCSLKSVNPADKTIETTIGPVWYDHLVLAIGATNNFYGMQNVEDCAYTLKSISQSIFLRNNILYNFERALVETSYEIRKEYLTIAIVGGGPTGVELAGSIAEMRNFILPKDYEELNPEEVEINLIQTGNCVLEGMSEKSQEAALKFLRELGVNVRFGHRVTGYDGLYAELDNGNKIKTRNFIWAAGVKARSIPGLENHVGGGNRIIVNEFNRVEGQENIYALGDLAIMKTEDYALGHPQVAQVAIQQSRNLARNLKKAQKGKPFGKFQYDDKGTMATIGRHKAVADLPRWNFSGFVAWILWLGVHLYSLIGLKNRVFVFINWIWNYFSYDQSLRLIIRPYYRTRKKRKEE